jgi:hypothetical protein
MRVGVLISDTSQHAQRHNEVTERAEFNHENTRWINFFERCLHEVLRYALPRR